MPALLCTVRNCHQPLKRDGDRYVCEREHSFDISRSGYINLLQPQDRRSRNPGDSAAAIEARRRFLDRGFAEPLQRAIVDLLKEGPVLDAGCGEGYYLGTLCGGQPPPAVDDRRGRLSSTSCCGIDISAAAIDLAARRYPDCQWVVANADRFVPYADRSFSTVMSITGRMNRAEFRRVLVDDGRLLVAVSAPDDLVELHGPSRDRVQRTIESFAPDFQLIERRRATTVADLDAEAVRDIRAATYRPRSRTEGPARVTLSLDLLLFR
jgi:23S rRNA (guanine745-N1)-methyltransferase